VLGELQPGDPAQIGPYRLSGVLGTGGMGRVYLGWSASGQPAAVKVIRAEIAANSEFRARFRREVAAAHTMSGRFTAPLADADLDGPTPWLATEYVAGPSLAEAVASHGPLPADSVRSLAAGLAEALAAIHAAGLVHRDLKPSNVLLASDGPRVIDFGISRAADTVSLTSTGQSIGSPGYLSPEQAIGKQVGPPTDIFSLGAVLAFAATGNGPFGEGSLEALVYRVVHQPPNLDDVPTDLGELIERCLAKDPGDRPTASGLLTELAAARPAAGWLPEPSAAALAGYAVAMPSWSGVGGAPTVTSVRSAAGQPPVAPPPDRAPQADGGKTRPSRSPLLRRNVLVPALSVVAVLVAAAIALAATLGGPGGSSALGGGSPTQSISPVAAPGHLLASASASSKPTAAKSTSQESKPGPAAQAATPTQPASAAQAASVPQAAAPAAPATRAAPRTSAPAPATSSAPPSTKAAPAPTTPAPTTPAPTPTLTPFQYIHYSGATTVACSSDGTVASGPPLVPISLVVTNNTSYSIQVFWINKTGALVLNADLSPGQIETFHTDEGDYWMISRSTGACFDIFLLHSAATLTAF
jgi:eukaryotic-like serine/threonine-protein kinase